MRFSAIEKEHLVKAWIAVSLAFAILYTDQAQWVSMQLVLTFTVCLLTVGLGFLAHELSHKYLAQRYGCWAEFRANDGMLLLAVLGAFTGFVFAAPGAVMIHGLISREKHGRIALAGPGASLIMALVFFAGTLLIKTGLLAFGLSIGFRINAWLALFNMIPFLNFDGKRIWEWDKKIYGLALAGAGLAFVVSVIYH